MRKMPQLQNRSPFAPGALPEPWPWRLLAVADRAVASPLLAYGAILALQFRVIWDVWRYKDLTFGDTSSYFLDAAGWAHGLHDDIVWSPLYTDFWGTIVAVVGDVYTAAMIHRIAIVIAASLLVLALMRSLLGPAMGLFITLWWVLLPPNYNVEYEVHLFGLLPVLVAALLVSRSSRHIAIGISLAILAGATLLLRNELVIATVIFAGAIIVRECREWRVNRATISKYVLAYVVPLAVVALLVGGAYWRSHVQGHEVQLVLRAKQDLNVCQVYAFNYQQRHPAEFTGNPFTDCAPLMERDFGRSMPSFLQATTANPHAMAAFALWNARLLGSGLQVALFGATATGDEPDYFAVQTHRAYTLVLTAIVLAVIIAGLVLMFRDRKLVPGHRVWPIIVLGAVGVTTIAVVLSQRPRAEYMYGLTVGLFALTGLCACVVTQRLGCTRFLSTLVIATTVVLIVLTPSHYHPAPRPIHDAVERLQVIRPQLQRPGSVLLTTGYGFAICNYLAGTFDRYCSSVDWPTLKAKVGSGSSLRRVLNQANVTAIYADPLLHADPAIMKLLRSPRSAGWRQIAKGDSDGHPWSVLIRAD